MSRLRAAFLVCVMALTTSLLLARVHPFGDAGLQRGRNAVAAQGLSASISPSIPPGVRTTLAAKCGDCHSSETHAPLYGRFAPVSWLLERDILAGRRHMDLSQWDSYSAGQQQAFMAKIVHETRTHAMPLPQYRMIHWDTRVTDADVVAFSRWAGVDPALQADLPAAVGDGDPAQGQAVFEKRCTGCHALDQNREGPHLRGVYGRTSGTVAGFPYSPAVKDAHGVWNDTTLEQWLTDPDTFLPGTNMDFHVAKPQERRDLIRFLKQLSDK